MRVKFARWDRFNIDSTDSKIYFNTKNQTCQISNWSNNNLSTNKFLVNLLKKGQIQNDNFIVLNLAFFLLQ